MNEIPNNGRELYRKSGAVVNVVSMKGAIRKQHTTQLVCRHVFYLLRSRVRLI